MMDPFPHKYNVKHIFQCNFSPANYLGQFHKKITYPYLSSKIKGKKYFRKITPPKKIHQTLPPHNVIGGHVLDAMPRGPF